jgi:hypothetical protein
MDDMARETRRSGALMIALVVLATFTLGSCGPRAAGYGVMLWGAAGPDDPSGLPITGSVVAVIRESLGTSTYLLSVPGKKTGVDVPMGRVRLFKRRGEAAAFAKLYAENAATWGFSGKQDPPPLPIREEAKQDAKTVYKLKPKQMVKVVSRSAEKQTIKPYSDYWYEVTTEDGFGGWVFGHFLKVFTVQGDPVAEAQRLMSQDETLDRLLGSTWRPDYFRDMVAKGMIDLSVFREDVGLFPSPSENIMKLQLPLSTYEFPYTGIEKLGASSYVFTGTDLRITVLDQERITVNYHIKGQPVSGLYAIMTDDIVEVIAAEQQRRQDLYAELTKPGAVLASSAYGTIRLGEDMRFAWQGFDKLVPSLIGAKAKGGGRIDLTLHLAKELAGSYDGVIAFLFDEYADEQSTGADAGASFLYKAAGGGLRLTSLGRDSVKDLQAVGTGISPVVIFFSQSAQ